ncbi:MAG TPA: DMT family transporter [Bacteroidetes bacterium]|nr:DMT family transporter [Bacteroidota bacterium]
MDRLAPLFVIAAAMLWGFDGIILRPALHELPVALVVFLESTIVTVMLTPFFKGQIKQLAALGYKDILSFFGVAVLGGAVGTMAITKALFYVDYVNLSIPVLIQKLQPVFAIFLAAAFLKEKLPKIFFFWAGLAVLGAYLMTFGLHVPAFTPDNKTLAASGFALIAAMSFGASTVLSKRALANVSFELGTYFRFLISSLIMMLIVFSSGLIYQVEMISTHQALIIVMIAFIIGGPAIFLYYYGLKKITASVATICELAFPLTAVLLEYVVRGHILSLVQWAGVIVLILSIIKVTNMKVPAPH